MPDQPQPDFSQTPQYAPGFQAQQPIPGISSSFPQFPQQSFNPGYSPSPFMAQQADMIAVQSMTNASTTMAIAQQNLMNSMHNALLGTMNAFSDVTRRGGSMITAMAPVGAYNDMLAPNQNWALESSFRREIGFGLGKSLGLDPYNSTFSRLIQGRRPEFLTEGEYSSTMHFAGELRSAEMMKGLKSVAMSAGLGWGISAMGIGLAPAFAIPAVVGIGYDRMLEAEHAEHEDLLRQQMYVKNKRVGIGQQFINTNEMAKVHGALYEQSNPYWSRFFGDNSLGRAFKPDVDKMKIFSQAQDNGLLSMEALDADSLIKKVYEISTAVEKFSRIGKVTREASIKMMADLKGAGIQGGDLLSAYKQNAVLSNVTGIDMETMTSLSSQAGRMGEIQGYTNFSAGQAYVNTLSGFAMMQAGGLFAHKDIQRMTQVVNQTNTQGGPLDIRELILRFGSQEKAEAFVNKVSNGQGLAQGLDNAALMNLPQIDRIRRIVDLSVNSGAKAWEDVNYTLRMYGVDDRDARATARSYYNGFSGIRQDQTEMGILRTMGKEPRSYNLRDMGASGDDNQTAIDVFGIVPSTIFKTNGNRLPLVTGLMNKGEEALMNAKFKGTKYYKMLAKQKLSSNATMQDINEFSETVMATLPIMEDGKMAPDIEAMLPPGFRIFSGTKDSRFIQHYLTNLANPTAYAKATEMTMRAEANTDLEKAVSGFAKTYGGEYDAADMIAAREMVGHLEPGQKEKMVAEFYNIEKYKPKVEEDKYAALKNYVEKLKKAGVDVSSFERNLSDSSQYGHTVSRIHAAMDLINSDDVHRTSEVIGFEKRAAHAAGLSLSDWRKAYQPFKDLQKKYSITGAGEIPKEITVDGK